GGSAYDQADAIAVDASGAALVTGYTYSADFPTTPGAFDTTYDNGDAFVTKLDATGSSLLYSTFLGGHDYDVGLAIALDASGATLVTGYTYSVTFPTTPGAYDTQYDGDYVYYDSFVVKLDLCVQASAMTYGAGWPGTLGVPSLTSSSPPVLCSQITISIG